MSDRKMTKCTVLFAAIALWLVAVSAGSDDTQDSRRLKGGKPHATALNSDVPQLAGQTDVNVVVRTRKQLNAGKGGLRRHTTLTPRLPTHFGRKYESRLTTNVISPTVKESDGGETSSHIYPLSQLNEPTEGVPVLASHVDEEHLKTSIIQSEISTSRPMLQADIDQHQNNENLITEISKTSITEIKTDITAPVIIPIEDGNEDIGENHPLMSNSGENSDEDSAELAVESRDLKSRSEENGLQPSIEKTNSEDQTQKQNHASRIAKPSSSNQGNTKTNSHPRPLPVVAVNLGQTTKPQQRASKQTPAPLLSHGNRRKLPPLGLHPKSPWIKKNPAQVSTTPLPANSLIQRRKPHVQSAATPVPMHGASVHHSKNRQYGSATSVPAQSERDQQRMNMVQATATTVLAQGSHVQQRKNVVEARATSVPVHGSNVQPRNNRGRAGATSISENVQQVLTLQTVVPPGVKRADSDEKVDSRMINEEQIISSISQKTPQEIISNIKLTENKKRVAKLSEMSNNGHDIPKTPITVSSPSNGRLSKRNKPEEKNAPGEKTASKVTPKKRTDSGKVDVKPQSSSSQLTSRHSAASNAVALTSIGLISLVTFVTIMGVYFKKISFSRKRYGQHILLSTEEDDLPLFNRQTNYNNYESPYKSWQDL